MHRRASRSARPVEVGGDAIAPRAPLSAASSANTQRVTPLLLPFATSLLQLFPPTSTRALCRAAEH